MQWYSCLIILLSIRANRAMSGEFVMQHHFEIGTRRITIAKVTENDWLSGPI